MNRPVVMLLFALGGAACIDANRSQRPSADVPSDADADADSATAPVDGSGDDARPDADSGPGECDDVRLCEQPSAPCAEAVCEAGRCVVQQRAPNSPCEDNDRCTGDGTCQGDTCVKGAPVEDGTDCDDDAEFCNGTAVCEGGECVATLPGTCPQIAAPCVDGWECSEALRGGCAPVPSEDGTQCQIGEERGECSLGTCVPEGMVWIAEGVFTMGCDEGALCPLDARPAHDVMLSGYAIDRTEVTEEAWRLCVAKGECQPRVDEAKPAVTDRDPDEPVRDVSWSAALQLCTAQGKALCTEAQWEKAARGVGAELNFPWGNTPATCERAVFHELTVGPGCGEEGPSRVGSKPAGASPYGVLDLAGNVAEWVRDSYAATFYDEQAAGTPVDPVNEANDAGVGRVIRGGGWGSLIDGLRLFKRTAQTLGFVDDEVGLRCCWAPDPGTPVVDP